MKIYYNPNLKKKAQKLRRNSTYAERLLWKYIKGKQLLGYQFSRQKPINEYIVDFYCNELKLIIEIDGISHNNKKEYDNKRNNTLKKLGFEIIRFDGYYLIKHIHNSIGMIISKINEIEQKTTP